MKISEVLKNLLESKLEGYQLSKRNGILSSTWLLFKKDECYFYFDINQKIEFIDKYKYSEEELLEEFKGFEYYIDVTIS